MVQLMPLPSPNPIISSLILVQTELVLPFWYRFTQVVLEESPIYGCSVVVVVVVYSTVLQLNHHVFTTTVQYERESASFQALSSSSKQVKQSNILPVCVVWICSPREVVIGSRSRHCNDQSLCVVDVSGTLLPQICLQTVHTHTQPFLQCYLGESVPER